ncbi:MAG: hypothetical protein ACP5FT_01965 [Acidilobus sp.]
MSSLRLSVTLPQIVLGLPAKNVENPYLAAPSGSARVEVNYKEGCQGFTAAGVPQEVAVRLHDFWSKLAAGLELNGCLSLSLLSTEGRPPPSSLYASLTVAVLHAVARSHSDVLDEYEIVEMGRMSDPWEGPNWWQGAIDAMRFCSATGNSVAYRNDEEAIELAKLRVSTSHEASEVVGEGASAEELGESVYDAFIHAIGQAVLEASDEVRSGSSPSQAALKRSRVQNSVAYLLYGVRPPEGHCVWVPGLPGVLELVCING